MSFCPSGFCRSDHKSDKCFSFVSNPDFLWKVFFGPSGPERALSGPKGPFGPESALRARKGLTKKSNGKQDLKRRRNDSFKRPCKTWWQSDFPCMFPEVAAAYKAVSQLADTLQQGQSRHVRTALASVEFLSAVKAEFDVDKISIGSGLIPARLQLFGPSLVNVLRGCFELIQGPPGTSGLSFSNSACFRQFGGSFSTREAKCCRF
jgi:hypothetical protein